MVETIFRSLVTMTITGGIVGLVVILFRISLARQLPKRFSYYLWFIVLIRLIIPLDFSSNLSLFNYIPNTREIIKTIDEPKIDHDSTLGHVEENQINNATEGTVNPITSPGQEENSPMDVIPILSMIWLAGSLYLMVGESIKYIKISKMLDTATIVRGFNMEDLLGKVKLKRNLSLYSYPAINSPLVYGFIRPKIIVPVSMVKEINNQEAKHILTHELFHIKRFDYIFKFIWSIVLCLHWFNPIVWLSSKYFNEDMELSCDELVMTVWDEDIRKDYANSLITIGHNQNPSFENNFLAFGETNIKTRIKNIMNFKKPRGWITLIGLILVVAIGIFTLTDAMKATNSNEPIYREALELAYGGYIDNLEFSIGDSAEDLIDKLGEPEEIDYYRGGLYLKYEDFIIYTDGYRNEDGSYFYGQIGEIDTYHSYGIEKDMDIYEVLDKLGSPDGQIIYDEKRQEGEGDIDPRIIYYPDDYMVSIVYDPDTKLIKHIRMGSPRLIPDIFKGGFLGLSDREKEVYENFILDFDESKLASLSPLSTMKVYLHAIQEKNHEAQWELYTKDENRVAWDKENHMKITADGMDSRIEEDSSLQNPIDVRIIYTDEDSEAIVSWEDQYLEEYDNSGNPFRFSFGLHQNKDYIWKVVFLPMN